MSATTEESIFSFWVYIKFHFKQFVLQFLLENAFHSFSKANVLKQWVTKNAFLSHVVEKLNSMQTIHNIAKKNFQGLSKLVWRVVFQSSGQIDNLSAWQLTKWRIPALTGHTMNTFSQKNSSFELYWGQCRL